MEKKRMRKRRRKNQWRRRRNGVGDKARGVKSEYAMKFMD